MDSRWNPGGFQVELEKYLAGLPAKEIPPGLHLDSWNPGGVQWIPPGIYGGVKSSQMAVILILRHIFNLNNFETQL